METKWGSARRWSEGKKEGGSSNKNSQKRPKERLSKESKECRTAKTSKQARPKSTKLRGGQGPFWGRT